LATSTTTVVCALNNSRQVENLDGGAVHLDLEGLSANCYWFGEERDQRCQERLSAS
jgi:hypothetical protein